MAWTCWASRRSRRACSWRRRRRGAPRGARGPALAFAAGVGAHGWVGIYFIASAEAGGPRQSGLLSGVAFAAIVVGLLLGAPLFGVVLQGRDSYRSEEHTSE